MEDVLCFVVSAALLMTIANCLPPNHRSAANLEVKQPTEEELYQNEHAQYQFASNVEDRISDLQQQRFEVRDGSNVKGSYSYSDGYFKRIVNYVADKGGYRVISSEAVPLAGPKVNPNGQASVDTAAHGLRLQYTVQARSQKVV